MDENKEAQLQKHINSQIEIIKNSNQKSEKNANELKSFTNNQKRFQYDYEEDLYEPGLNIQDEEEEYDEYSIYDQDEDGTKYPRIPK